MFIDAESRSRMVRRLPPGRILLVLLSVILSGGVIIATVLFLASRLDRRTDLTAIVQYIAAEDPRFTRPEERVIMIANLGDLTCPPCFDDFIALAESLSATDATDRVAVLLTDGRGEDQVQREVLKHWAVETGLPFACAVIEPSLLSAFELQKSQALVIDQFSRVRFQQQFPLGERARAELLAMLRGEE